ncbi:MAG TPA: NAD(P)-dependent oxidoreductase [Deltaproteobacteria bacterium]|nr:NAD(P)-dependent oxidoreductase [Deltaproteobacteria bacterium]HPJ94463.1 NAD(P)-dependent oxidoreductase [Deltaproteobacteria bacterium]HPR52036.1 NAD(P)-dependent oxidoreductase [Deltaproteobacteria bacterium]
MLSGKTFLVTGATGRLGCETVLRLEDLGASVQPLVLPGYPLEPKRVAWEACSKPLKVHGREDLDALRPPDYVINFHWRVDRTLSCSDQLLFEIKNNVQRPAYFWEWLADNSLVRFVNISSIRVFSPLNHNPISSMTEPRPLSPYGIAKMTAEHFFDACFAKADWPVVHLRLCSVASPGEHPSHLMSRLYASAFDNQEIVLNSGHTCSVIYIDEVVDLIITAALSADSRRYIITAEPVSIDRIASAFERISGKRIHSVFRDLEPGISDRIFASDRGKLHSSWTRSTPLDEMIENYIEACTSTKNRLLACTNPHYNCL